MNLNLAALTAIVNAAGNTHDHGNCELCDLLDSYRTALLAEIARHRVQGRATGPWCDEHQAVHLIDVRRDGTERTFCGWCAEAARDAATTELDRGRLASHPAGPPARR